MIYRASDGDAIILAAWRITPFSGKAVLSTRRLKEGVAFSVSARFSRGDYYCAHLGKFYL